MSQREQTQRKFRIGLCSILSGTVSLFCVAKADPPSIALNPTSRPVTTSVSTEKTQTGYLMATVPWSFPRDHGRHDGFKTEWWYFAGNVVDNSGRKFGYQLTFFRVSISPIALPHESALSLGDYYFAHAAVSDLDAGKSQSPTTGSIQAVNGPFHFRDRMAREETGVAFSAADTMDVALRDWSAKLVPGSSLTGTMQTAIDSTARATGQSPGEVIALSATDAAFGIQLACTPKAGDLSTLPVLEGPGGVNLKGREHGEASYYYSIPRLPTSGTIVVDRQTFHVTGNTWMDHEFSSDALGVNQVGWDWVGLTLADGNSLMVYRLRNKSGGSDFLSGTLIDRTGRPKYLTAKDITFTPSSSTSELWKSSSGGLYPQVWSLSVTGLPPLIVRSRMAGQELRTDATTKVDYFEGSCELTTTTGKSVGEGYLEMTGYAKPISPF